MTELLSRDAILGATDLPTKDIEVKAWGGIVRIRSLTGADRDSFEESVLAARREGRVAPVNVRARYAAMCIIGEDGQPLFTEQDIEALGRKSASALQVVFGEILAFNALSADEIEELLGNSAPGPNDASTSD